MAERLVLQPMSIPERLDALAWNRWHTRFVLALGITWLLDGLEGSLAGSLAGALQSPSGLSLSDAQLGVSSSFYLAGAVIGSLVFGVLADRLGRRRVFFWTLLCYLIATAATGASWSLTSFTVCRFITGAGIGGEYAAVNSAIDEFIPARLRGRADLAINGTFWLGIILGSLVSTLLLSGQVLPMRLGWRFAFVTGVPIGLVVLALRRSIPESPRWLIGRGRAAEAGEVLLQMESQASGFVSLVSLSNPTVTTGPRQRMQSRTLLRLYRKRALVCLCLMTAQALLYNSVFFSLTLVLMRYYGAPASRVGAVFVPIAIANFLGPLLLGRSFDTVGRKPMIAGTFIVAGLLLAATGLLFWLGLLTITTQVICWAVLFFSASAAASGAYLSASELFPLEVRATAISLFYATGTLLGGVSGPLIFGRIIGGGSRGWLFAAYLAGAIAMILGGLVQAIWGTAAERKPLELLQESVR